MDFWKEKIYSSLVVRNKSQKNHFSSMISTYQSLLNSNHLLQSQNDLKYRESVIFQKTSCSQGIADGLICRIKNLEETLYEVYKLKTENIEAILKLKEFNHGLEESLQKLNKETNSQLRIFNELDTYRSEISEFLSKLKISSDFLSSQKAELELKLDHLLSAQEKLISENSSLKQRLLVMTEDQMFKQNEIIEISLALKAKESFMNDYELVEDVSSLPEEHLEDFCNIRIKPPRKELYFFKAHEIDGTTLAYSSSGNSIISSGTENYLKIWNSHSAIERQTLRGYRQPILCISISSCDDLIIAGSCNNSSYVWNAVSTKLKHTLNGHSGKINGVSFIRSATQAVSASEDRTIKLWDLTKGFCTSTISTPSIIYSLAVNSSDTSFITGHKDGEVRMYSTKSQRAINLHTSINSSISACDVSACGNYLAISTRSNLICVKDLRMFEDMLTLKDSHFLCPAATTCISISPCSKFISAGSFTGEILTWNLVSGTVESVISHGNTKPVPTVHWNPNDSQLCSIDTSGFIGIWI